jgi:GDPmannose 4,6-dehydratase
LFNHESPLRPDHFVTRKITTAVARIANGSDERLKLGDISIHRDWGWAPDYVEAMWMMLQHGRPEDFVIASGVAHRLDEFVSAAFAEVGLAWQEAFAIRGATPQRRHGNSAGDQGSALQR